MNFKNQFLLVLILIINSCDNSNNNLYNKSEEAEVSHIINKLLNSDSNNYDFDHHKIDSTFALDFLIIDSDSVVSFLENFDENNLDYNSITTIEKEIKNILNKKLYIKNEYEEYIASLNNIEYGSFDIKSNREALKVSLDCINLFKQGDSSKLLQIKSLISSKLESSHQYFNDDWYSRPTLTFNNRFIWKYFSTVGVFNNQINMVEVSNYEPIFDTVYCEYLNNKKIKKLTIENDDFIYKMKQSDIQEIELIMEIKKQELNEEYPFQLELMSFLVKSYKEGKSISYYLPEF